MQGIHFDLLAGRTGRMVNGVGAGFWTVVFIAMWAVTGVYFAFPSGFRGAIWWTGHAGMHRACLSLGSSHHLTTRPRSW